MFDRITRRVSPATAIASVALFVSLGGVGYAAATIGSAQIKDNSVQGKDIRNGTIKSPDIARGTRNALKGNAGPAGVRGPAGANGTNGTNGAPGTNGAKGDKGDAGTNGTDGLVGPSAGFMGRADNLSVLAAATQFGYVNAAGAADSEAERFLLTGNEPLRATGLDVTLTAPPLNGTFRVFNLRVNGVDTELGCVVVALNCEDVGSVQIPANARVSLRTQAGPVAPAAADAIYSITLARG